MTYSTNKMIATTAIMVAFLLFSGGSVYAQVWCWAVDTSLTEEAGGAQTATADLYGNIYTFSQGKNLIKHKASTGSTEWVKAGSGSDLFECTALTTDERGNLYAYYDSTSAIRHKLIKVDSFGNTIWSRTETMTTSATLPFWSWSITSDNIGHIYTSGYFAGTAITAGSITALNTAPYSNSYIVRYDTLGNVSWVKTVTSPGYARVYSVEADHSGNIYMAGIFRTSTLKILDSVVTLALPAATEGIFVAKCDSTGHLLWVTASKHYNGGAGPGAPRDYHINVDYSGNAYVAGKYWETDTLGTIPITATGGNNIFVAKYSATTGTVLWAKTGGTGLDQYSFATNAAGQSYIIMSSATSFSHFDGSAFSTMAGPGFDNSTLVGLDSAGNVLCGYMLDGYTTDDMICVTIDNAGNAYVNGDYIESCTFGGITLTTGAGPSGGERYFLAKYTCNCLCSSLLPGNTICVGNVIAMTGGGVGGTWTSSNVAVGTVNTTGMVTGISPGTAIISYVTTSGCMATGVVTVTTTPVTGTTTVCVGGLTTLTTASTGGAWVSSDPSVATVGASSGVVSGLAVGTTVVSYSVSTGCPPIATITVIPSPNIFGDMATLCEGYTLAMYNAVSGGTWSSSSSNVIVTPTGNVTGLTAGTAVVTYTISTGCFATTTLTIHPAPAPITGPTIVYPDSTITLSDATPGGIWYSSDTTVATVNNMGVVTGKTIGTATIYYTSTVNGCRASVVITVMYPSAVNGHTKNTVIDPTIFPNPATDELTIRSPQGTYVLFTIENNQGQEVLRQAINITEMTVSIKALPAGIYYATFSGERGIRSIQFVKR